MREGLLVASQAAQRCGSGQLVDRWRATRATGRAKRNQQGAASADTRHAELQQLLRVLAGAYRRFSQGFPGSHALELGKIQHVSNARFMQLLFFAEGRQLWDDSQSQIFKRHVKASNSNRLDFLPSR